MKPSIRKRKGKTIVVVERFGIQYAADGFFHIIDHALMFFKFRRLKDAIQWAYLIDSEPKT